MSTTKTMMSIILGGCPVMAFLATTDAARSRAFYEEKVGLHFVADEEYALVFDAGGIMLRVQKVQALQPAQHTALGWTVDDIPSAMRTLVARGVVFSRFDFLPQDEQGVWSAPGGAKIAWFKDPDGNTLSLTQF